MYLFSKRIKCQNCGKNFKGLNERGTKKYICSGYHNYGLSFCVRWKVDESYLVELVQNHYEIELLRSGVIDIKSKSNQKPQIDFSALVDRVEVILVDPKQEAVQIRFKDGTSISMTPSRNSYYLEN